MRKRAGKAWLPVSGLLVVLVGAGGPVTAGYDRLIGRVSDRSGAGIGDATVVLMAASRFPVATTAAQVVRTSSDGLFAANLPPGRYRVAAYKPGYGVSLTEVNTLIRGVLQVELMEAARTILGDLPADAPQRPDPGLGWILRGASSDILRDEENGVEAKAKPGQGRSSSSLVAWLQSFFEPLDGELVQHFSGATLLGEEAAGLSDLSGRSTSLALRGAIGDQGTWRFAGLRGRLSTSPGEGPGGVRQDRSADRMQVGLDYRLGPDDNLKADLRYGTNRYVVDPNGETVNTTDQDQTSVGLRSRWDRTLGESARLYVEGAYVETAVRVPDAGASTFASLSGGDGGVDRLTDRSGLATAGLAFETGEHRLDFGIRAKRYRYPLRDRGILLYTLDDSPTLTEPGESGDAVSLYGNDDWRVGARSILNCALRYHSNLSAGNASMVPRLGLTIEPSAAGGTRVRSMVLFRLDDPGLSSLYSTAAERRAAPRRDIGRLGYAVSLEKRPEDRLQFAATLSYKPFEEGPGGDDGDVLAPGAWGDALIFLTDGAAGRHEMAVEVERGFGDFHGSLSGSLGRVDGRLTPAVEEAPVQILSLGEVRYSLTRLRALYEPTETEVRIDYRRVQAETGTDDASDPTKALDYRRLDLTVAQDLPRFRNGLNARFKVLMAYQGLVYGSSSERPVAPLPGVGPLATSRLTGGVDIRF